MRLVSVDFYIKEEDFTDYAGLTKTPKNTEWLLKNVTYFNRNQYHQQRFCTVEAAREDYGRKVLSKDAK